MKKNLLKLSALLFIAALFTLSSCNKDDADAQSAEDAARGSYIMADAFAMGNEGTGGGKAIKSKFAACAFTYAQLDNGFSLTWQDCTDDYGITRNGTLIVTGNESVYDNNNVESASLTIEFVNYTIEGQTVSGRLTFTVGTGLFGYYLDLTAENFKIIYPDNTSIVYNSANITYVFSILNGFKIEIIGSSDGTNRNGQHFTTEIEDMKVEFFNTTGTCAYPTQGIMTISVDGEKDLVLDYDSGTCGTIKVSQRRKEDVFITIF